MSAFVHSSQAGEPWIEVQDDFESGLSQWSPLVPELVRIVPEPGTDNQVLELSARRHEFSHVLLSAQAPKAHYRMDGRFQFPVEGDGYLGFIYNYAQGEERFDFGCIYIKSNGSYVRLSPHYDGMPSWRLYEEYKFSLAGDRVMRTGKWYRFRLDVHGRMAALYIDDMVVPVMIFDEAPAASGLLGLEARPGGGEPVWVDDIRISKLQATANPETKLIPASNLGAWQYQRAIEDPFDATVMLPHLDEKAWMDFTPDTRGAVITGLLTQSVSGQRSVVYLRATFEAGDDQRTAWLAVSSANRMDVWFKGYFRGTVAPEQYIWSDHVKSVAHHGARLPLALSPGRNELLFRVYGDRFAGGGFFAEIMFP